MTTTALQEQNTAPDPGSMRANHPVDALRVRRARRIGTIFALIAGLLIAGLARPWAMRLQDRIARTSPYYSAAAAAKGGSAILGSMDSFTLALLLGGLRGPLVMFLWCSSEQQKNERDLEDLDTKIELIRLLQPEFDTVHLFQIWNKAYNISAQFASRPNKYVAILDALDYARNVDASRPNDINIQFAIAQLYSEKLGGAVGDKDYYIQQVRKETRYRPPLKKALARNATRRKLDPLLDAQGNLLPNLVEPTQPYPASPHTLILVMKSGYTDVQQAAEAAGVTISPDQVQTARSGDIAIHLPQDQAHRVRAAYFAHDTRTPQSAVFLDPDWNSGAQLQYLAPYSPFPYGVSPLALGYNYAKRAQSLMTVGGQVALQTSAGVIDSRPALDLKQWSEEDWDRAIELEQKLFAKAPPQIRQRPLMVVPTTSVPPGAAFAIQGPEAKAAVDEALFAYSRAALLSLDAIREFRRHMNASETQFTRLLDYSSLVDTVSAQWYLITGDRDYLLASTLGPGDAQRQALQAAAEHYRLAVAWYHYLDLRYFVPQELAAKHYPRGYNRFTLKILLEKNPAAVNKLYDEVIGELEANKISDENVSSREEYKSYWQRAQVRVGMIDQWLNHPQSSATQPATAPATALPQVGAAMPLP